MLRGPSPPGGPAASTLKRQKSAEVEAHGPRLLQCHIFLLLRNKLRTETEDRSKEEVFGGTLTCEASSF